MMSKFFLDSRYKNWHPNYHAEVVRALKDDPSLINYVLNNFPRKGFYDWRYREIKLHEKGASITLQSDNWKGLRDILAPQIRTYDCDEGFALIEFPKSEHIDYFKNAMWGLLDKQGPAFVAPGSLLTLFLKKIQSPHYNEGKPFLDLVYLQHHYKIGKSSDKISSTLARCYVGARKRVIRRAIDLALETGLAIRFDPDLHFNKDDSKRDLQNVTLERNLTIEQQHHYCFIRPA